MKQLFLLLFTMTCFVSYGQANEFNNTTDGITVYSNNDAVGVGATYGIRANNTRTEDNVSNYGMYTLAFNDGATATSYGIYAEDNSLGTGLSFGGYFANTSGSSTSSSYGIYARNGNTDLTDFAGFFNGRVGVDSDVSDVYGAVFLSEGTYDVSGGPQEFSTSNFADFFILGAREGSNESTGIAGEGDALTLWSPGDGVPGAGGALMVVCDEDRWNATDTDPYNNTALVWYLTEAGGWIASDMNRKDNVEAYSNSLEKIAQLGTYTYNYKLVQEEIDKGQVSPEIVGVIAQEVAEVIPQAININESGEHFINYNQVTAVLIGAVNELNNSVSLLSTENEELKAQLDKYQALEARLEALESNKK